MCRSRSQNRFDGALAKLRAQSQGLISLSTLEFTNKELSGAEAARITHVNTLLIIFFLVPSLVKDLIWISIASNAF